MCRDGFDVRSSFGGMWRTRHNHGGPKRNSGNTTSVQGFWHLRFFDELFFIFRRNMLKNRKDHRLWNKKLWIESPNSKNLEMTMSRKVMRGEQECNDGWVVNWKMHWRFTNEAVKSSRISCQCQSDSKNCHRLEEQRRCRNRQVILKVL